MENTSLDSVDTKGRFSHRRTRGSGIVDPDQVQLLKKVVKEGFQKHPYLMLAGSLVIGGVAGWILVKRPQLLLRGLPRAWSAQTAFFSILAALQTEKESLRTSQEEGSNSQQEHL